MKERFKLKHLDILLDDSNKDMSTLMIDILGYKNSIFGKTKFFLKNFLRMKSIVAEVSAIDYENIELNENSHIKKPNTIDEISYLQMLNLKGLVEMLSKYPRKQVEHKRLSQE